jgi:hypothetical protein
MPSLKIDILSTKQPSSMPGLLEAIESLQKLSTFSRLELPGLFVIEVSPDVPPKSAEYLSDAECAGPLATDFDTELLGAPLAQRIREAAQTTPNRWDSIRERIRAYPGVVTSESLSTISDDCTDTECLICNPNTSAAVTEPVVPDPELADWLKPQKGECKDQGCPIHNAMDRVGEDYTTDPRVTFKPSPFGGDEISFADHIQPYVGEIRATFERLDALDKKAEQAREELSSLERAAGGESDPLSGIRAKYYAAVEAMPASHPVHTCEGCGTKIPRVAHFCLNPGCKVNKPYVTDLRPS